MVQLDDGKLMRGVLAGMLITFGVVAKNTSEQASSLPYGLKNILPVLGMIMFVGGWALEAYTLGEGKPMKDKLKFIIPSAVIVVVVMLMKKMMKAGKNPMPLPIIFAVSWLLLGFFVQPMYGTLAAVFVLLSMLISLPWQRKSGVIDGPGMPLFVIAWFMLAFLNARGSSSFKEQFSLPLL